MHSIITQLSLILISSFISIYILFDFFNKIFFRIYRSKIVYVISFLGDYEKKSVNKILL